MGYGTAAGKRERFFSKKDILPVTWEVCGGTFSSAHKELTVARSRSRSRVIRLGALT